MISVHVCDDHSLIIHSLSSFLKESGIVERVSSSRTITSLLEFLRKEKPTVLILDLNVQKLNSLDYLEQIRMISPEMKIIILTSYDSQTIIREAIKLKVDGFLSKNTEMKEVIAALFSVLDGKVYVSGLEANRSFDLKDTFQIIRELSEREKEIIRCLVKGYPNKKISDELCISITTVQTHRRNIYRKLSLKGLGELVSFAYRNQLA